MLDISFWNDFIFMQLLNNVNRKFHSDLVTEIWKRDYYSLHLIQNTRVVAY